MSSVLNYCENIALGTIFFYSDRDLCRNLVIYNGNRNDYPGTKQNLTLKFKIGLNLNSVSQVNLGGVIITNKENGISRAGFKCHLREFICNLYVCLLAKVYEGAASSHILPSTKIGWLCLFSGFELQRDLEKNCEFKPADKATGIHFAIFHSHQNTRVQLQMVIKAKTSKDFNKELS